MLIGEGEDGEGERPRAACKNLLADAAERRLRRCGSCSSATARSTARRPSSISAGPTSIGRGAGRVARAAVKRPLAVINCASASAPFINRLAGENRVVITATKSGDEQNFARFGQYIVGRDRRPAGRPRQGRPGLAAGGVPDRLPRRRGVLRTGSTAGHRARPARTTTATAWARRPTGSAACARRSGPRTAPRSTARGPTSSTSSPATANKVPPEVRKRRDELELAIATLARGEAEAAGR